MSRVTSVLLSVSVVEDAFDPDYANPYALNAINDFLAKHGKVPLARLDEGMIVDGKHPQAIVLGGGYNYLPVAEFLAIFDSFDTDDWAEPWSAVLIIDQEEIGATVWRPKRYVDWKPMVERS